MTAAVVFLRNFTEGVNHFLSFTRDNQGVQSSGFRVAPSTLFDASLFKLFTSRALRGSFFVRLHIWAALRRHACGLLWKSRPVRLARALRWSS
jgi:hypothetical protein